MILDPRPGSLLPTLATVCTLNFEPETSAFRMERADEALAAFCLCKSLTSLSVQALRDSFCPTLTPVHDFLPVGSSSRVSRSRAQTVLLSSISSHAGKVGNAVFQISLHTLHKTVEKSDVLLSSTWVNRIGLSNYLLWRRLCVETLLANRDKPSTSCTAQFCLGLSLSRSCIQLELIFLQPVIPVGLEIRSCVSLLPVSILVSCLLRCQSLLLGRLIHLSSTHLIRSIRRLNLQITR